MVIIFILIIILCFYFYGKWLAHNASVNGQPQVPTKKRIALSKGNELPSSLSIPPLPPPLPKAINYLERDDDVAFHPIFPDYLISYCDRNGERTERRITIQRIEGELISAYCHLRHGKRTFYTTRVSKWINCDSGEVILDISEDFRLARKNSVYGTIDRMFEDLYPIIGTLLYLGKGDNRLMINERTIIIRVFRSLCNDSRLTDELINDGLNEMMVPSRTRFKTLIKELSLMDCKVQSIVLDASKQFFESRKKLNPIEKEALNEINRRLTSQPCEEKHP